MRREYPDLGRGDFRIPAVRVQQANGSAICQLKFKSHEVIPGKPKLDGLSSTYGEKGEVETLVLHLHDNLSSLEVDLSYSVFPAANAIVRSAKITNKGKNEVTVDKAASWSGDLPFGEYDMLSLRGDHNREAIRARRKVEYGVQR